MELLSILILLISSHFICDYVFQTDAIATGKNRNIDTAKFGVDWRYWMTTHAITHGVGVGLVTGSVTIGVLEAVSHWIIDFGKCESWYGLHIDQILHVACKLIWVAMFIYT